MKIRVTMKDPDALPEAIREAVERDVADLDLPSDERRVVRELCAEKADAACGAWLRYGEYITVEIDTDAGTCEVVKP